MKSNKVYIQSWLDGTKKALAEKQARRDQRKSIKTSLKEGSILCCSWGYEQTNFESFRRLTPWDGKPQYCSWYG
jgi:hypothetical protein